MALERLTSDRAAETVTYRSDKADGPTAGTETADALEFLARVLVPIPDQGQVTTRYHGWYANRPRGPRGLRRRTQRAGGDPPVAMVVTPTLAPTEASRRWAALLRQIFEVDPLVCPRCPGPMRIVACITQAAVMDQILMHIRDAHPQAPDRRRPAGGAQPASASRVRGASRTPTARRTPGTASRTLRFPQAPAAPHPVLVGAVRRATRPRHGADTPGDPPVQRLPGNPCRRPTRPRPLPVRPRTPRASVSARAYSHGLD